MALEKGKLRRTQFKKKIQEVDYKKFQSQLVINPTPDSTMPAQDQYDILEKSITNCSENSSMARKTLKKQLIITEEIEELIQKRHTLKNKENKTRSEKQYLSKLYRIINKGITMNIRNYRLTMLENYIQNSGAVKKAYKTLNNSKQLMTQLQNASGTKVTNRQGLLEIATEFYKNLYSNSNSEDNTYNMPFNCDTVPCFNENEIELSIDKLKLDKSPGSDGIKNEHIKAGKNMLIKPLTNLFNQILIENKLPSQWACTEIILLYKKGDPTQIANYRPISLMPCLYKVFSSTLLRRISRIIDDNQGVEQAGFMKNRSTVDHIHTLKTIIEKYNEYGKPLYISFIDYSKAFDSISHNSMWRALAEQGVNEVYINIIKEIYKSSKARIKLESYGPTFNIQRGVRQGDPLSPKIFIAVLEQIFRALDWDDVGLKIHGQYLSHLRFADDLVLLSEDPEELQYMLQSLNKHSKKVGLEMNQTKTKVMTNRKETTITMNGVPLEWVDEYVYLGHLISVKDCSKKEITRRIKNTWNKYWSMKEIFKSELPTKIKTKAMEICLMPCLTYACQTWSLTKESLKKVRVCQRAIERSYMGIKLKDKVKNTLIRENTKAKDVVKQALKLKWKWAGHIQRMNDDRWAKITTNWYPINKTRRRGRPYKRWDDDITTVAGKIWSRLARDRERWRTMEEAYTAIGGPYM